VFRRFAQLRERLVPYLEAQATHSVASRRPLMRALFFDWPTDAAIWAYPFEYMLGDYLLVAPVTASAAELTGQRAAEMGRLTWPVYVPAGDWVDAWTGSAVRGPIEVARPVPLDEIPVYVRADAWERLGPVFRPDHDGADT
jgi:alpha-glucosidase (family GH31 glycosyl hydrolase)